MYSEKKGYVRKKKNKKTNKNIKMDGFMRFYFCMLYRFLCLVFLFLGLCKLCRTQ